MPPAPKRLAIEPYGLGTGSLMELQVEEARPPEPVWLAIRTANKGKAAGWCYQTLSRSLLSGVENSAHTVTQL